MMRRRIATGLGGAARTSAIHLRPMTMDDLASVFELEKQCHLLSWPASFFRHLLRTRVSSWVFEQAGSVIGYGLVRCANERAHIMNLCIAPAFRRHGLGRKMLVHLLGVARSRGAKRAWLEVFPSNQRAIALYRRLGFQCRLRRKGYYRYAPQRQGDALVMTFDLER
jgi:ribosomal-protein-alanine N-acetyltransferase